MLTSSSTTCRRGFRILTGIWLECSVQFLKLREKKVKCYLGQGHETRERNADHAAIKRRSGEELGPSTLQSPFVASTRKKDAESSSGICFQRKSREEIWRRIFRTPRACQVAYGHPSSRTQVHSSEASIGLAIFEMGRNHRIAIIGWFGCWVGSESRFGDGALHLIHSPVNVHGYNGVGLEVAMDICRCQF